MYTLRQQHELDSYDSELQRVDAQFVFDEANHIFDRLKPEYNSRRIHLLFEVERAINLYWNSQESSVNSVAGLLAGEIVLWQKSHNAHKKVLDELENLVLDAL